MMFHKAAAKAPKLNNISIVHVGAVYIRDRREIKFGLGLTRARIGGGGGNGRALVLGLHGGHFLKEQYWRRRCVG